MPQRYKKILFSENFGKLVTSVNPFFANYKRRGAPCVHSLRFIDKHAVVAKNATTAADGKTYKKKRLNFCPTAFPFRPARLPFCMEKHRICRETLFYNPMLFSKLKVKN
jgi:hypothetical protein